ncbi:MAG: carboxymuconolactone decarboxylase family protein [Gammaproteobacteria bacterium]
MKLEQPRVPPLDESDWTPEQIEVIGRQTMRGNVPNVFKTLIHHEKLAKRWLVFATHILSKNSMSPREREIAILRTGWLAGSDYEWGQHVIIGQDAGLTPDEIEAIKTGSDATNWSHHERLILRACDELHKDVFISDEVWEGLTETYSTEQMMDLIFTCGQYRMLAGALNSLGVPLDEDIR